MILKHRYNYSEAESLWQNQLENPGRKRRIPATPLHIHRQKGNARIVRLAHLCGVGRAEPGPVQTCN